MDLSTLVSKLPSIKDQVFEFMSYDSNSELTDEQISVKFDNAFIDLECIVDEFSSMMPDIKTDEQKKEAIDFLKQVLEIAKTLVKVKKQISNVIQEVYTMKNKIDDKSLKLAA